MSKRYYWSGGALLETGSIVLPGNWYRIVSSIPGHHCSLREEITERIRAERFPSLPSRRNAIFVCDTLDELMQFLSTDPRPLDVKYEVELVHPDANTCKVDSGLAKLQNMNEGGRLLSIDEYEEQAVQYWRSATSENLPSPEIITESAIRIIRRI